MENEIYKLPEDNSIKNAKDIFKHCTFSDGIDWLRSNLQPVAPSVSREKAIPLSKFASLFRRNDYASSVQIIKSEITGLPITQVIDGELMIFIATHEPETPAPSNHKTYYCSVCHKVPVDAENGFDTCSDCVSKI